jgi:2-oxoglutarate ferredoxin oxidoreductase subunit beta
MTGGQMAPTTLIGQKTTSTPRGREVALAGYPVPMTEMLAVLPGVAYAARGSIIDPSAIGRTKAYIRKACEAQLRGEGFAIVEVLSNCPVGWGMTPQESISYLKETVVGTYVPGVIVDRMAKARPAVAPGAAVANGAAVAPGAAAAPGGAPSASGGPGAASPAVPGGEG